MAKERCRSFLVIQSQSREGKQVKDNEEVWVFPSSRCDEWMKVRCSDWKHFLGIKINVLHKVKVESRNMYYGKVSTTYEVEYGGGAYIHSKVPRYLAA